MESTHLGIVLDSSILIAAERRNMTPDQAIQTVQEMVGELPIVLCSVTVAEIGHGIYRANTPETRSRRRQFLDELKSHSSYPCGDRNNGRNHRVDRR
jgi:predicted nucleic acid-binding protein